MRPTQHRKRRRRKGHGMLFPLLHSVSGDGPLGPFEIDLRPQSAPSFVGAHSREGQEFHQQARTNPRVGGPDGVESSGDLVVRQRTVRLRLRRTQGHHLRKRTTTRIMGPIALADCPRRDDADAVANPGDRLGESLLQSLQDSDNVERLNVGHPKSPEVRIDVPLKHTPPLTLHGGTGPVRPLAANHLLDSLGERGHCGGTPVDERVNTVGDERPNSQRALTSLPEAHVRITPVTKRTAATTERGDTLFPAFGTAG